MTERQRNEFPLPDPVEFSRNMMRIASQSQDLISDFLKRHPEPPGALPDPMILGRAFLDLTQKMMEDPAKLVEAQASLWQDYMKLWQSSALRMMGHETEAVAEPERGDKRFRHDAWTESQVFDFIKQSYLLTARWMQRTVRDVEGLDQKTAEKVDFYTRQFADAVSPSNFLVTNPEVLERTFATNGENLVKGLSRLLRDLERGEGRLAYEMTDMEAFEVGGNIAVTPGKVVFQNELIQLIQYDPATETVYKRPLLIVPPWINKFYILDLRPENSFIRWALGKGYTIFVVSWVNPDEDLAKKYFKTYMSEGILQSLDAIEKATGEREVTAIGYCIGGTLLAATLAYMAARGDDRIKAATFFAAQVDFSEAGELAVFIDDEELDFVEARMREKGYLSGADMSSAFNMLRANDLIWNYVIRNYLLGEDPFPFDLLYWNADTTRLPYEMHRFYLRECYQNNNLVKPGGITLLGVPIDLGKIEIPVYIQASKEDHIAPANSVYKATGVYKGPVRFMLAGSGHIAGVINPPAAKKYQHWVNDARPESFEEWFSGASERPGSWWEDWHKWLSRKSGRKVDARIPGSGALSVIEDAPGSYVKQKSDRS